MLTDQTFQPKRAGRQVAAPTRNIAQTISLKCAGPISLHLMVHVSRPIAVSELSPLSSKLKRLGLHPFFNPGLLKVVYESLLSAGLVLSE